MIIVLLGPPGSGKGTQARRICKHYKIPHLSTGDLLRAAVRDGSPLGKEVAGYIDNGHLVPDQMVIDLVADFLAQHPEGCLLDGFPRTIPQAEQLELLLAAAGKSVARVIELRVPRAEIERRLTERARIEGRPDDTLETIAHRLDVYQRRTQPLIDFYSERDCLTTINGAGPPEDVFQQIREHVDRSVGPAAKRT